ncbi:MAG TPA: transglutaminase-like cysteine peptidase [Kiloniellaceae bacterium]|nr:transglutaminase-like cysteine peptidase [Kiloniellaceae bacterium]
MISLVSDPVQRRNFLLSALAGLTAAHPLGKAAGAAMAAGRDDRRSAAPGVFGYREVPSTSFQILPQWERVLGCMRNDGPQLARCSLNVADCDRTAETAWHRLIGEAMPLPPRQRADFVNRYFNRWPYRLDQDLYGVSEYWASPIEFLGHSGDCEDYSIAKFFALRQLGLGNERLRVIILLDSQRNVGHAVLAFYDDREIYILDSLSDEVLPHWHYPHYKPQYSMNETTRWTHLPA